MPGVPDTRPTMLVFHKLTSDFTFGVTNYSPGRFYSLLRSLTAGGSKFGEEGRGALQFGFDDGYEHLVDHLPELMQSHHFRPIVFVPTDLAGQSNHWDYSHFVRAFRHLSPDQIKKLADQGVIFGSHGTSHCDLTNCDNLELKRELSDSRKRLQDWTGQSVDTVSYPFGRWNRRVRDAAAAAGYRFGYTMEFPKAEDDDLSRGRVPVYGFDTPMSVSAKLGHGPMACIERAKSRVVSLLSGGTVWLNRIRG